MVTALPVLRGTIGDNAEHLAHPIAPPAGATAKAPPTAVGRETQW